MKQAFLLATLLVSVSAWAAATPDQCEVTVDGAVKLSDQGSGNSGSVGTDYWLADDELRQALRALAGIGRTMTDAEKDAQVEKQMRGEPRFVLLLLNCNSKQVNLNFGPAKDTRYKDLPMKAGSYTIAQPFKAKPGDMLAMVRVQDKFYASQGGKLEIREWNKKHLAGRFELKATSQDKDQKAIALKGSFDFPCRAGKLCEK